MMHDTQYRCQIAAQNVSYNQPAHASFFLGTGYSLPSQPNVYEASSSVTIPDGWYYIKNTNAQKYLQVTDNSVSNGANAELGTGTGVNGQKWYVSNQGDGTFTLKNGQGYMLDVCNGSNEYGTNIRVWSANGADAQKYKLVKASGSEKYAITTVASNGTKALDAYNFGTTDGTNICQWTYYGNANQFWIFESTNYSGSSSSGSVSTSYDWNFSDSAFSGLGTISSSKTVNNLTLLASSEKAMNVNSGSLSYNGMNYSSYLALNGGGSTSYRALKFNVNGSCTIMVTAKSSGSSTRTLALCDANGNQLTGFSCSSSIGSFSYNYTGSAGTLYLYSTGSGINLFEVKVS